MYCDGVCGWFLVCCLLVLFALLFDRLLSALFCCYCFLCFAPLVAWVCCLRSFGLVVFLFAWVCSDLLLFGCYVVGCLLVN